MRTRRTYRPFLESMPSRIVPSDAVYFPINPLLPVKIPTEPPNTYVSPTAPYHIRVEEPYHETIVGPDDSSCPPPLGTPRDDMV
jgi:hypothetical protein